MHAHMPAPTRQDESLGLFFDGLTPRQAKRRALNWWYSHQRELGGMSAQAFFARCRLSDEGGRTRIVFHHQVPAA